MGGVCCICPLSAVVLDRLGLVVDAAAVEAAARAAAAVTAGLLYLGCLGTADLMTAPLMPAGFMGLDILTPPGTVTFKDEGHFEGGDTLEGTTP